MRCPNPRPASLRFALALHFDLGVPPCPVSSLLLLVLLLLPGASSLAWGTSWVLMLAPSMPAAFPAALDRKNLEFSVQLPLCVVGVSLTPPGALVFGRRLTVSTLGSACLRFSSFRVRRRMIAATLASAPLSCAITARVRLRLTFRLCLQRAVGTSGLGDVSLRTSSLASGGTREYLSAASVDTSVPCV